MKYNYFEGGSSMLKMKKYLCFLLYILLPVLIITGCEEEGDENPIIGIIHTIINFIHIVCSRAEPNTTVQM